jgi:hypothetical protein
LVIFGGLVAYPLYLRSSLTLRLRIAEIMRDPQLTAYYRRRISDLHWNG